LKCDVLLTILHALYNPYLAPRSIAAKPGPTVNGTPAIPLDARPQLPPDVHLVYEEASRRWVLL
jgi:hypothetical protein